MSLYRVISATLVRLLGAMVLLGLLCLAAFAGDASDKTSPPPHPKLAVLVVFDQLRGDYPIRWRDLFGESGWRRLQDQGAWFQNCHYPYSDTLTAVGHASLLTGCSPAVHGIIGNEWFDRAAGKIVYCVASDRYVPVPAGGSARSKGGASPDRLLAPSLGDGLKDSTHGKGRIVSLSLKDRSAVLPGGRRADACYWFNTSSGQFVTSSFYRDRPHPWVEEANQARVADRWFNQPWTRLRPLADYVRYVGPDEPAGKGGGYAQGRAFPHPLTGALKQPGKLSYEALTVSPFGNDLLLDLVKRAIDGERLGQRADPDLLCISFSSNDLIGHSWGPDSHEVLDVTLRSDLIVGELLAYLDAHVGKGNYLLALTADHGVCPLPEATRKRGKEAERLDPTVLSEKAEEFLSQTFHVGTGKGRWLEPNPYPWLYLNRQRVRESGREQKEIEEALAGWFRKQPGILAVYTRTALQQGLPKEDEIGERIGRSFHADRSGNVVVVQKPYYLFSSPLGSGTTHGTPHSYDTHVPLFVFGPGIRGGVYQEQVTPQAIAAVFARHLGIPPPGRAEAPVPKSLVP